MVSHQVVVERLQSEGFDPRKIRQFFQVVKKAPEIWQKFEAKTLNLIESGERCSAITILGLIRRDVAKAKTGEIFNANNNHAPFYARIFTLKYPQHAGYFRFKADQRRRCTSE